MKKNRALVLAFTLLSSAPQWADTPSLLTAENHESLIVYNRILAKINDKTLSVIDVMKKMDLFLQRNYPELVDSKVARFQFYSSQWRDTLAQMIDQELMIADAERLELKVSDAEVREEMLERFGPTIMATLDKLGLSYEEARSMIHSEMIVQRMMWFRVNSKALNTVNPQDIKDAYKQFCLKNPALEQWKYQVLSVRSPKSELCEAIAHRAFDILHSAQAPDSMHDIAANPMPVQTISEKNETANAVHYANLNLALEQLKNEATEENQLTISVSSDLDVDEKSIADAHKEVLKTLTPGTFSAPIAQVSRVDQSVVYRIFHLKEHSKKEVPQFESISDKLKDSLLEQAVGRENSLYITKLRERLGYDEKHMLESLPDDFQPFALK
ncbi:MAG: SurA N-terminal domain-containing protein [Rhabdochlamydiaceae bacterium]|nr:SurA N-terminal domain-containing protein [Rhabdochlamydiaceae bacterium]